MKLLHPRAQIEVRTILNGDPMRTPTVAIRNIYEHRGKPSVLVWGSPVPLKRRRDGTWVLVRHIGEVKALSGEGLRQKLIESLNWNVKER